MDVDIDKLTAILAERMAAVVPDGIHVRAADGKLWYSADEGRFPGQDGSYRTGTSGTYVGINFYAHGQSDEDRIAGVAAQALSELQDYVDEATHDPWPGMRTPPRARALVRDRMLLAWYGGTDPDGLDVVLACSPVPLPELQRLPGCDGGADHSA